MLLDRDNWQEIFATIRKNKWRTTLTMIGVGWGIFMLVIMLGSGNGLKNGILNGFAGSATNSFFLWTQKTSKPYKGMQPGRTFNFNNSDAVALAQVPELDIIAPQNQLGGYQSNNNVARGTKAAAFSVMGQYPVMTRIEQIKIKEGRYINDNDILEKRKVCVVGSRVIEVLFKPEEKVLGEYIRINGIYFMIIGVVSPSGNGQQLREQAQKIHIPFTTFQKAFNYGDIIGWFAITSQYNVPASVAETKVMSLLKERHKVAPEDQTALGHWNMEVEFNKLEGLFAGIEVLIWFVGIGTLIAGVIGISNIMLIVVKERTKEIGVKRALGATPFNVVSQIMLESVFLTVIAGYLGLLFGIVSLELLNQLLGSNTNSMFTNPTVDLAIAVKALLIIIVSGAFAGFIPARRAVAVQPVEALRME